MAGAEPASGRTGTNWYDKRTGSAGPSGPGTNWYDRWTSSAGPRPAGLLPGWGAQVPEATLTASFASVSTPVWSLIQPALCSVFP